MQKLLAAALLLVSSSALAVDFNFDFFEDRPATISGETLVVFNHSSSYWNPSPSELPGSRKLLEVARRKHVPTLAVVARGTPTEKYYVQPGEIDHVLQSRGGAHELQYSGVKRIIVSGGFLQMCLCEFIRDSIQGIPKNENTEIWIALEATYRTSLPPLSFFEQDVFSPDYFCRMQNTGGNDSLEVNRKNYTIDLFAAGQPYGKIGTGPKRVTVRVMTIDEVEQAL